jgi:hypothetical protein
MLDKDLWSEPDENGYVDRLASIGIGIHNTDSEFGSNSTTGYGNDILVEKKPAQPNSYTKELLGYDSNRFLWDNIVTRRPPAYMLFNTTAKDEMEPPQPTSFVKNISYENTDKLTHLNWSVCSRTPNEYQVLELMLPGVSTQNISLSSTNNTITISIIPTLFGLQYITKSKLNLHTPLYITIDLVDNIVVDRVERSNGELRIRLIPLSEDSLVIHHTILE